MLPLSVKFHAPVVRLTNALEIYSALRALHAAIRVHFSVDLRGKLQQLLVLNHVRVV